MSLIDILEYTAKHTTVDNTHPATPTSSSEHMTFLKVYIEAWMKLSLM